MSLFFSREVIVAKERLFEKVVEARRVGIQEAALIVGVAVSTYSRGEIGVEAVEASEDVLLVLFESEDVVKKVRLPERYMGFRVEPYVVGKIRVRSLPPEIELARTSTVRPLIGGVSIGSIYCTAGTLGCIVFDVDGSPLLLSNNHVLGPDWGSCRLAERGLPIVQPGPYDLGVGKVGRECPPYEVSLEEVRDYIVGRLERWVPVELGKKNLLDAAVARPTVPAEELDLNVLGMGRPGPPAKIDKWAIGQRVWKSGRTTGITEGKIVAVYADLEVQGWGRATFVNQILCTYMSEPGDSGSYVALRDTTYPDGSLVTVGILFAGSSEVTVVNPATEVERLLNVRFSMERPAETEKTIRKRMPILVAGTVITVGSTVAYELLQKFRKK